MAGSSGAEQLQCYGLTIDLVSQKLSAFPTES